MIKKVPKEHHGLFFAVIAALLSALTAALIRTSDSVSIWTIAFVRFAVGSLILLAPVLQKKIIFSAKSIRSHLPRALFGLIAMTSFFYAVTKLSLMNALTFLNTAPLFLPLVLFFWRKKVVPPLRIGALILGFIGVVLILRPDGNISFFPAFIGLLSGLFLAFVQVAVRDLSKEAKPKEIIAHFFFISTVLSFFPMLYFWEPVKTFELWVNLILIAIASLLYQFAFTRALGIAKPTKVAAVIYLAVPFSGLLGWWFFSEIPSYFALIGTLLIMTGGVIAILSRKESRVRGRRE